jgi:hypothetical protein
LYEYGYYSPGPRHNDSYDELGFDIITARPKKWKENTFKIRSKQSLVAMKRMTIVQISSSKFEESNVYGRPQGNESGAVVIWRHVM